MPLQRLTLDDIKTVLYEHIHSVWVYDGWETDDKGLEWLDKVIDEEAPEGSCGYLFGEDELMGSPGGPIRSGMDIHYYKRKHENLATPSNP